MQKNKYIHKFRVNRTTNNKKVRWNHIYKSCRDMSKIVFLNIAHNLLKLLQKCRPWNTIVIYKYLLRKVTELFLFAKSDKYHY